VKYDLWLLLIANCITIALAFYFGIFVYPYRDLSEETKRRPRSFVSNAFFRELWYFLMEPLKKKLIKWNIEPNTITNWGLFFSILSGLAFAWGEFGLGGWFVIFASTCDVYDGLLARAKKISNKSGAFYDSTLDRVGEAAMFGGLMWFFRSDATWYLVSLAGWAASQMVSYSRARAEGLGFDKGGSRGMFQRAERMIVLSIGMALSPVGDYFWGGNAYLAKAAVAIITVGSIQTAWVRTVGIYREIRATEKN
jgi:CDP-diacylglycerol--glycerol-3-phosphate 3-phosphatidyltransferase